MKFIGYYNYDKIKYYLGSLQEKGMVQVAEIINGYNRYRLTQGGLSVMNELNDGFDWCLYEWCNKYRVEI